MLAGPVPIAANIKEVRRNLLWIPQEKKPI